MGMKIEKGNVKIGEAGYYIVTITTDITLYIKLILEIINIYKILNLEK